MKNIFVLGLTCFGLALFRIPAGEADRPPPRRMEYLGRGLVAARTGDGVLVQWRLLGNDKPDIAFHLYRDGARITRQSLRAGTNYLDREAVGGQYRVAPVVDGVEGKPSGAVDAWAESVLKIPIQPPAEGYSANDASVGDLDGDGEYELVLKWVKENRDNAHKGATSPCCLDAYRLDGRRLWRIDLGVNIRSGPHYTPFVVYDFDGDGRAEIACKTADGTVDGAGNTIGDPDADHRNADGRILRGPEFLTVFDGRTGAALATVPYLPPRAPVPEPTPAQLKDIWGDGYGNRVDRFLACVAYLDGERPSLVMTRGYYARTVLAAWDWRGGKLVHRWTFDSGEPGNGGYGGQGNHNLAVGDVDGDGKDEIMFGSCAVDDNGRGLYTTGLGHGDAGHLADIDPDRPGLEYFMCHESGGNGVSLRDAATGEILWNHRRDKKDVGRCLAAPIVEGLRGWQCWGASGLGFFDSKGNQLDLPAPASMNFAVWWDGDLRRELLDHVYDKAAGHGVGVIVKYDGTPRGRELLRATGTLSNNATKGNPCLQADLFGDWREEVVWRNADSTELRIFTTPFPTEHRLPTLMHDPVYRLSVAWQNAGYNQPPHPGFYLGEGMAPPPRPNIAVVQRNPE